MKSLSKHLLEHFGNTAQLPNVENVQESIENNTSKQEANENKEEESED